MVFRLQPCSFSPCILLGCSFICVLFNHFFIFNLLKLILSKTLGAFFWSKMSNSLPHRDIPWVVWPPFLISKALSGNAQHLTDTFGLNNTLATQMCDPTDYWIVPCLWAFSIPYCCFYILLRSFSPSQRILLFTLRIPLSVESPVWLFCLPQGVFLPSTLSFCLIYFHCYQIGYFRCLHFVVPCLLRN